MKIYQVFYLHNKQGVLIWRPINNEESNMIKILPILASLFLSFGLHAQSSISIDLKKNSKSLSISSYEKTVASLNIDEAARYDIFAIGQARGELILESTDGSVIDRSSDGSLFKQRLKAGKYILSHVAAEVPQADSVDCGNLGKACEWLKSKLFHPEILTLKIVKTTKIDADAKPGSFLMMNFKGAERQFISLKIKEAGSYFIKTSLYNKTRDNTTIFLYDSPRPQPNMELIAKDRDSGRRSNSSNDAAIKAELPKGDYLIKVIDSNNIMSGSSLKYMISVVKAK